MFGQRVLFKIWAPIYRDRAIYLLMIIICAASYALTLSYGVPNEFSLTAYSRVMGIALLGTLLLAILGYYFYLLLHLRPHPLKHFYVQWQRGIKFWPEWVNFVLLGVAVSMVLSCFTTLKMAIPVIKPYYLDPYLSTFDQWLHGGHLPWEITHHLFNSPRASLIINLFYNLWFFVVWLFLVFSMCLVNKPELRQRMIIANCLTWILNGGVFAILLSSVGPPYAEHLFPAMTDYQGLFRLLHSQNDWLVAHHWFPVWALDTQKMLWQSYMQHHLMIGAGISAMPSVHVSEATLVAISLSSLNKKVGAIAWLYAFIILIGSIHLGWHYASDGYLAIILTTLIWYGVGRWQHIRLS